MDPASLVDVRRWMTRYIMTGFLAFGLFGNLINVFLDEAKPSVIVYSYLSIGQAAFIWIVYYTLRRAEDARFKAQLHQQKQK